MRITSQQLENQRHSIYVIDDDEQLLPMLVQVLTYNDFIAKGFSAAEEVIASFPPTGIHASHVPDLFIVDLQLSSGKKTGLELVRYLAQQDVPSEILAISGQGRSADVIDDVFCFGSADFLDKPFGFNALRQRAEDLSKIGRNRRLRRLRNEGRDLHSISDPKRARRPVFLSYAEKDVNLANGVRRHLEFNNVNVWYAPTSIEKGTEWRKTLERAIDSAFIFIPLLSDHYMTSPHCLGELTRFRGRMERDQTLLLLPVINSLSEENKYLNQDSRDIIQTYQCIKFHPRLVDGLTALRITVERTIQARKLCSK